MTARSLRLRRLIPVLLTLVLIAPLHALAQAGKTRAEAPNAAAATPPAPTTAPLPAPAYTGPAYDVEIVIFRAKTALGLPENWAAETTAGATVAGGEASGGSGPVGK